MKKQAKLWKEYLEWIKKQRKKEIIIHNLYLKEYMVELKKREKDYFERYNIRAPLSFPLIFFSAYRESMEGFYNWLVTVKYKKDL